MQLCGVCGRLMTRQPEGRQKFLQSSAEGKRERGKRGASVNSDIRTVSKKIRKPGSLSG